MGGEFNNGLGCGCGCVVVVVKLALVDIKILHNMDFMFIIAKTFEE